ncbi:hypothetical protein ACS0TY_022015 [Phlomoides rotata]
MGRKCSHCGNIGHNSRTCNYGSKVGADIGGGVMKLFGVHIYTSSPMKKRLSFDCSSCSSSDTSLGYLSDAPLNERKKAGVAWTEEEHRSFLVGLEMVGKGDWRGISRNYVPTRTPTQVASHAQKYFLRLSTLNLHNKNRRSSLFDMVGAKNIDIPAESSSKS